jgi:hypothetical protein
MQNSVKVENAVLGETTFSGGISTTLDKRMGGGEGESSDSYVYVPLQGSGLTNKQVFELTRNNIVIFDHQHLIVNAMLIGEPVNETEFSSGGLSDAEAFSQYTRGNDELFYCSIYSTLT